MLRGHPARYQIPFERYLIPPRGHATLGRVGGIACAGLLLVAATLWAREGERVIAVEVRGARTVAQETILARAQMKAGHPYREAVVSEDIRRLFALGYFTDVRVDVEQTAEGLRLVFVVTEKPTVSAVKVEGNRALSTKRVLELFGVGAGELHDPRKVKEGVDQVEAEYVRKGYAQSDVLSRADIDAGKNEATLYLLVDEGPRMRVREILVEGNRAFPDRRVRKLMKTKRRRWWFFPAVFSEQVLEEDLERVRAFYRKRGYQDVAVQKKVYRGPSGRGLSVHLLIEEGLQHRVGRITLEGVVLFPEPEILRTLTLAPGAVYNADSVQEDLRAIKSYYGARGYIKADVAPDPQLDPATKRVNLTYHIVENELVYVNRIAIRGNYRTKDQVVRRELRVYPGERFDGERIRKSLQRLYNLGFFEEVNVETEPTDDPTKEDLVVEVKEAKTGSFSFGGGFSSVDRLVGLIELEQRNFDWRKVPTFTGAGQDLRFRTEIGSVRRYFDLSFTEPWIFGHPVSFGIDLFNRTRLRSRNLGLAFEEERRGAGVRLGREFADVVRTELGYQFFRTEISDVADEASTDLKAEEGKNNISVLKLAVGLDRRDNRFEPTEGYYLFTSGDLAGGIVQGDRDFVRFQAGGSHYWPHGNRLVFESRVRGGIVNAYGESDEVPIFERFFAGGSGTIRGFRERKVGPRDPSSGDPIGGEATFVATVEEVLTLVTDERDRPILKGTAFVDAGDVWRRVDEFGESFKAGAGMGVRVTTPIGPVRLDVGFPLKKLEDEKRKARFHFNISRGF